jgi:ubiquinone/menaquinone biosynthesis C-methylase UbiE/DNA-binding transcriptional ArsR family regulator
MESLLSGLRAAAEPTRLRLLALCAHAELTVTELTQILGQSQPRVSRHLKLLCEAGLIDRCREGTWAFYRLADERGGGAAAHLARELVDLIPPDDLALGRDLARLDQVKQARAEAAQAYFRANAGDWDRIRSLYAPETAVETRLVDLAPGQVGDHLDLGTGTGRILELFAERSKHGLGIDLSHEMLAVARANLARSQHGRHLVVRHGDIYNLPLPARSFDFVTIHQVLHFADNPAAAITEAARVLKPGGRLIVVDFAPHELEFLRDEHAHRRLGFADAEVAGWYEAAGLQPGRPEHLPGDPLTVAIWPAAQRNVQ